MDHIADTDRMAMLDDPDARAALAETVAGLGFPSLRGVRKLCVFRTPNRWYVAFRARDDNQPALKRLVISVANCTGGEHRSN